MISAFCGGYVSVMIRYCKMLNVAVRKDKERKRDVSSKVVTPKKEGDVKKEKKNEITRKNKKQKMEA